MLDELKQRAAKNRRSLTEEIVLLLRLGSKRESAEPQEADLPIFERGRGTQILTDLDKTSGLLAMGDEDVLLRRQRSS